ncbi:MAG: TorF family putative porin [Pseudomonadales bacterium]
MTNIKHLILGTSLLLGTGTATAAEISGNVSLGTDYAFRGISQTTENPAVQGGFDVESETGFYVGIWGSNVDFDGSIEVDLYAGYGGSFSEDIGYDVGILRYEYPDDEQADAPESSFNEVYASISFVGFTAGLAWSPDFFFESDKATYAYINYEYGLPNEFGLGLHYGHQSIDDNTQFGTPDYNDYSIGLTKSVAELDLSLTWYDTDLSSSECFGGSDLCESRFVFAIGKSL